MAGLKTIIEMFSRKKEKNGANASAQHQLDHGKMDIASGDLKALKPLPLIGDMPARSDGRPAGRRAVAALLFLAFWPAPSPA